MIEQSILHKNLISHTGKINFSSDYSHRSFESKQAIMDVWSWICELPDSEEWNTGTNSLSFELATSNATTHHQIQWIQLRAERTFESNSEASLIFSLLCRSSAGAEEVTTLWISDKCHLSQDKPFLPLVLQLLQEIISRAPSEHNTTCPRSHLQNIKPDPISWILDSHSQESFSSFFNLIFLTRLFWLCVFEAPSEVGSLYFHSLLTPNLQTFSCKHAPALRTFFLSVGIDVELCFMRTFGYMFAKSLLLRELGAGITLKALPPPATTTDSSRSTSTALGLSYAAESHGMWILKGYIPVNAMNCVSSSRPNIDHLHYPFPMIFGPKESILKYALAHQQLEAVIQLEYTAEFSEGFIQVHCRVDNIRLHIVKLRFKNKQDGHEEDNDVDVLTKERHFPSRVRVWVGPEIGANYVGSLSLGRSTDNSEREMEMQKVVRGSVGKLKIPKVKGVARMATRTRLKNWRWDQDVEGNAAIFDGILCDNTTGVEVARGGGGENYVTVNNFSRRYSGGDRAFTKSGGVVFAGEDCGGENGGVGWRLNKDMEGSVLKWRIGVQAWLSYWPNDVKSSYSETRSVEWCDEIDLPLIPGKYA